MTTAQGLLKRASEGSLSDFVVANKAEYVAAILQLGWAPMLAAMSVLLEESQDVQVSGHCLRGMVSAILLLSISGMGSERDAFVSTLTQFTNLHCHTAREVRQKNLEAIQATMTIARQVGNFLGSSWGPVLRCISQLDRLQLVGHGQRLSGGLAGDRSGHYGGGGWGGGDVERSDRDAVDEFNSLRIDQEVDSSAIDRIFSASGRLSDEAIVDFVRHLCAVSREELDGVPSAPRVFSMQKIVEITYYNMSRIRIVWSRIWAILGEHFQSVALRADQELAMYAIDAMRQLAFKFLEKDELTSFHFQRDFLKPFDYIIANSPSPVIRELVVRCLTQVVRSTSRNIKSGWKNIFMVLNAAARDDTDTVVLLAFDLVHKLVEETLTQVTSDTAHGHVAYGDCVGCLTSFARNKHSIDISLKSVGLMSHCTQITLRTHGVGDAATSQRMFTDSEEDVRLWFPVLTGLGGLAADTRLQRDLRSSALTALFSILMHHGHQFSSQLWGIVSHGVLLPLFEDVHHLEEVADTAWLRVQLTPAIDYMTKLCVSFMPAVAQPLADFLKVLGACIGQDEAIAEMGITAIKTLIAGTGSKFSSDMWAMVCRTLVRVFEQSHSDPFSEAPILKLSSI
jgi:brefeldin A-inhibited guanine nucleotide-exchange protein